MTTDAAGAGAVGPLTHRRFPNIALPIVVSNMTVPILGAVDPAVVGQMGEAAPIGAVGIGAGDRAEADALLTRALLVAFSVGSAIIALQVPLFAGAFLLAPASDEVEALARDYMAIRVWSAPALIALYGIAG